MDHNKVHLIFQIANYYLVLKKKRKKSTLSSFSFLPENKANIQKEKL